MFIAKSIENGKEYILNKSTYEPITAWFYNIVETINHNWSLIFQAIDEAIDGYYAYYDLKSWKILSKKYENKLFWIQYAQLL